MIALDPQPFGVSKARFQSYGSQNGATKLETKCAQAQQMPQDIIEFSDASKGTGTQAEQSQRNAAARDAAARIEASRRILQEEHARLLTTKPVAAIALEKDTAEQVRSLAQSNGYSTSFGSQDVVIDLNEKRYTFRADGSVAMQDIGVPESEERRQELLEYLSQYL